MGIGHGDVISGMARNGADLLVAYFASLKLGAAFTTLNPAYTAVETSRQLAHSGSKALLIEDGLGLDVDLQSQLVLRTHAGSDLLSEGTPLYDLAASFEAAELESGVTENDLALIVYTSGTESTPKGVRIPHRNFLIGTSPAWTMERYVEPDDRFLLLSPMYTMAGIGTVTNLIAVGATIVVTSKSKPETTLEIISRERITNMSQTPTFYRRLIRTPSFARSDLSSLRQAHTYGGPIPTDVVADLTGKAPKLTWATYWGQTELTQLGAIGFFGSVAEIPMQDTRWVGRPVPQLEVRVVGEDGEASEVGELLCRSPAVMAGYHNDQARTEERIHQGWLRTGDIVRVDADLNLFFYDRKKDVIKTGGMNVSSLEVEEAIITLPGINEVAVVGLVDSDWSEVVTAFLVAPDGRLTEDEVENHLRSRLAPYKIPKRFVYLDRLPRDGQGKVLKRALRDGFDGGPPG
jgi:acyl-CoA synthetase (AMP-forming)/AMP-acid ligase II